MTTMTSQPPLTTDDLPECRGCERPIEGQPWFDETEAWWMRGYGLLPTPYHSPDCADALAERMASQ